MKVAEYKEKDYYANLTHAQTCFVKKKLDTYFAKRFNAELKPLSWRGWVQGVGFDGASVTFFIAPGCERDFQRKGILHQTVFSSKEEIMERFLKVNVEKLIECFLNEEDVIVAEKKKENNKKKQKVEEPQQQQEAIEEEEDNKANTSLKVEFVNKLESNHQNVEVFGKAIVRNGRGKIVETFKIGDDVALFNSGGDEKLLGQICSFFRERRSNKNHCEIRSYHFLSKTNATEVSETDEMFEYEVEMINSRVRVLKGGNVNKPAVKRNTSNIEESDLEEEEEEEEKTGETYVCNTFYSVKTHIRKALHTASLGGGAEKIAKSYSVHLRHLPLEDQPLVLPGNRKSRNQQQQPGEESEDVFTKAIKMLQLSAVPASLPCREKERDKIQSFMEVGISRGGVAHSLYVSGLPGTGKTATVNEVVRNLKKKALDKALDEFNVVELNGMKLPRVEDGYQVLCEHFLGVSETSWKKSHKLLDEYFKTPHANKTVTVLIVDEMDNLVTSNQTFLYNLFEWPSNKNAHLVCVAIANIMDLPEKLLPKINSRLGLGRVTFGAYQRDQIEKIIKTRLEGLNNVFESDAIEMCARKVASLSGDVRKALQLSRRAIEICKRNNGTQVTIPHVNQASKEITSRMVSSYVAQSGLAEKMILISLHKYLHVKEKNVDDFVAFKSFYYQLEMEVRKNVNVERITMQEALMICKRMEKLGLVLLHNSDLARDERIQCLVEIDDLKLSLQDTDLLDSIHHL